jgi:2-hydroxy-3-keto-5-methylthiopentenyl-1-phosphate phosphatase
MSKPKKPIIAICYDFDGTLSPKSMQEYNFIPQLGLNPHVFWKEVKTRAKEQNADAILTYMCIMIEKANSSRDVQITRKAFVDYGKTVELFHGVIDWFQKITAFGKAHGANIEHYIISSGIKEMIEGSKIGREFKKIYASSFMYDQNKVAYWPALAINYTTKTQFLFRINKGMLDVYDDTKINDFMEKDERPIPFQRMIYIGDGSTDIPCMKLVKEQGGYSVGVYKPGSRKKTSDGLMKENRVNFVAPADYTEDGILFSQIKAVINKMIADYIVTKGPVRQRAEKSAEFTPIPDTESPKTENSSDNRSEQ